MIENKLFFKNSIDILITLLKSHLLYPFYICLRTYSKKIKNKELDGKLDDLFTLLARILNLCLYSRLQ